MLSKNCRQNVISKLKSNFKLRIQARKLASQSPHFGKVFTSCLIELNFMCSRGKRIFLGPTTVLCKTIFLPGVKIFLTEYRF